MSISHASASDSHPIQAHIVLLAIAHTNFELWPHLPGAFSPCRPFVHPEGSATSKWPSSVLFRDRACRTST